MEKYDAVVIGAGIGGLICASLLTGEGYKVALFEKEKWPGGYCSSFEVDGYTFDAAVDCIGGLEKGSLLRTILEKSGVGNDLSFIELQPARRNFFPGLQVDIASDTVEYKEELKRLFPAEEERIDALFRLMRSIYRHTVLSALGSGSGSGAEVGAWLGKSFQGLLDSCLSDLRLKAVLSSYCTFLGLPSSSVSAIAAVNTLMHYLEEKAFRVRGGIQNLADSLVEAIRRNSGSVFLGESVEKLLTEDGRATGIITEKQRCVMADSVISNMDLITLLNSMTEDGAIEESRISRLNKLEVSASFVIVYLATDLDLKDCDLASSIGYFSSYDQGAMLNNSEEFSLGLSIPSLTDDSLAPAGNHIVIIHWPLCRHQRELDKDEIAGELVKHVERLIPNLSKHIILRRVADGNTLQRYTGNHRGAAYGWKQEAGFYAHLPFFRNIMENLFVVGHWAGYGGGVMPSAMSSLKVVEEITRKKVLV